MAAFGFVVDLVLEVGKLGLEFGVARFGVVEGVAGLIESVLGDLPLRVGVCFFGVGDFEIVSGVGFGVSGVGGLFLGGVAALNFVSQFGVGDVELAIGVSSSVAFGVELGLEGGALVFGFFALGLSAFSGVFGVFGPLNGTLAEFALDVSIVFEEGASCFGVVGPQFGDFSSELGAIGGGVGLVGLAFCLPEALAGVSEGVFDGGAPGPAMGVQQDHGGNRNGHQSKSKIGMERPERAGHPGEQESNGGGDGNGVPVSLDCFGQNVTGRPGFGRNRPVVQATFQVVREGGHVLVALLGLVGDRLEDDGVEVIVDGALIGVGTSGGG